jgi:type II secretory pathway pseudopilin PulG
VDIGGIHKGRGSILLEVILAVAIFTAAALVVLRQVSFASDAVQRARDQERAADVARSAMAMLEAGLETPETLNGPLAPARVAYGLGSTTKAAPSAETFINWELVVDVQPSPFEGLAKVRVTAIWGGGQSVERARYSLAQLVPLSGGPGGRDADGGGQP